ncbi:MULTISPECIES: PepSY-associated TM helix domain-containing protein [unclassified Pseudomonas]|uniref:PepSY-associated TM helix domain-containing protein n=1 Tax=unclassified Pseudomonas TaxID=196821 RepID=UPI0035C166D6
MKAKTITQKLSWLHTWAGLVFGWVLFAIFLTGTLAVFDKEIDGWMRPEIPAHAQTQMQALHTALGYLQANHPDASAWNVGLPTERSPTLSVSAGEQRRGGGLALDPETGEPLKVRETAGGSFFFRFHFTLNLPRNLGIWVVGLAAMAMLATLVSGIVIHKKFFKEFFTFRPAKGQRSWLDAHNATGVLVLPFHLMITYTGLVIFYLIYMPAASDALFNGDRDLLNRALRGAPAQLQVGGQGAGQPDGGQRQRPRGEAALTSLEPLLAEAERQLGPVASLSIHSPGRSDARVEVRPVLGNRIELNKGQSMVFDGVTGQVLRAPAQSRPSLLTQRVMAGMHFAQFGGYPMRWLYFVCGLASCAMIATGLVLFTVKRRRRHAGEGALGAMLYHVAERLNVSVVAGLAVACIGLLWANRLLPLELGQRGGWEVRVFFLVWLASLGHAIVRPRLRAWQEQLGMAALLCLCLPLLNLVTVNLGDYLALEITTLTIGALLGWCCWRMGQPAREPVRRHAGSAAQEGV